jgi:hypothetical protein
MRLVRVDRGTEQPMKLMIPTVPVEYQQHPFSWERGYVDAMTDQLSFLPATGVRVQEGVDTVRGAANR